MDRIDRTLYDTKHFILWLETLNQSLEGGVLSCTEYREHLLHDMEQFVQNVKDLGIGNVYDAEK